MQTKELTKSKAHKINVCCAGVLKSRYTKEIMDTIKNCGAPKWALLIFMYTQYTQGHNIRRIMRPKTLLVWGWFLERKKQ